MASNKLPDNQPPSRSMYMSSDGDGEVEVNTEDVVSDAFGSVSIVELCQPCRETDNKKTDARWKCTDCDKFVCDDCKKKHDVFIKDHTMISAIADICAPCLDDDKQTEATWHCVDCDKCMCDTCNSYHGKFFKNHSVIAANIDPNGKFVKHQTATRKVDKTSLPKKFHEHRPLLDVNVKETKSNKGERKKQHVSLKHVELAPSSPKHSPLKTRNEPMQAPIHSKKTIATPERTLKLLCEKSVAAPGEKEEPVIEGSAFLPDGRLLLLDGANFSLKLFSADLNFSDQIVFDEVPWDVAVYDTNEMSVSFGSKKVVRFRLDRGMKLKEICSVSTNHVCCGITYITKDQLAVVTGSERALVIMTIDGKDLQRISTDTGNRQMFTRPWYVAVDVERSRMYVSDSGSNSVIAINMTSHEVVYIYQHKQLEDPYGLAVDKDGYVYVCGFLSDNIHRITQDGVNTGIFPVKVGQGPITIAFNPNTNDAIVAGSSSTLELYSMV